MVDADEAWRLEERSWYRHPGGYVARTSKKGGQHTQLLHREIMGLTRKDGRTRQVDHMNRCRNDNRRRNLRVVTHKANCQNRCGYTTNRSSRFRNVSWDAVNESWRVRVGVDRETVWIGRFKSEIEADEAARKARQRLLPFDLTHQEAA